MSPSQMKNIRITLNWSQEHLARQLGISLRSISRYEAGHTPIPNPVSIACKSFVSTGNYRGSRATKNR